MGLISGHSTFTFGQGFNSHTHVKQYIAGEETAGLAEINDSLLPGLRLNIT